MRHFLGLFVLLLLTFSASAEVVAGRRFILVHDQWAPAGGGAVMPLGVPAESAAFDGERFLVVWREGTTMRIALFDEGASTAIAESSVAVPPFAPLFVRWEGSRYVVAAGGDPGVVAVVSPQGVLESVRPVSGARSLVDVAASASGVALLLHYSTETHSGVVDVMLLDSEHLAARRTTVGAVQASTGFGATWIGTPRIVPFGSVFYVVWREARAGRYDRLLGTQMNLDGSAVAGTLLETAYAYPSPYAVFVHPYGTRLAVNAVREWGSGITTTLVEQDGTARQLTDYFGTANLPKLATVRLPDGSIFAIYVVDGVAKIKPVLNPPAAPPRRRSARH